jgi:hypothetical protein
MGGLRHGDAALGQRSILGRVEGPTRPPARLSTLRDHPLAFGRQGRHPPVARVNYQRRSPGRYSLASLAPELVVRAAHVGFGRTVAAIGIHLDYCSAFEFIRFRVRQELLPRELRRTFERRHRGVGPDPLEARPAVRRARENPGPCRRGRGLSGKQPWPDSNGHTDKRQCAD